MSKYEALIQEGEQKGEKIGRLRIIIKYTLGMHKEGISIKKIARITKLSEAGVKKIIKENSKK